MTNINGQTIAAEDAYLTAHEVAPGYFLERVRFFERKYQTEFQGGWGDFLGAYTQGRTDQANLDFDEWAFFCEHFMRELTESWRRPPVGCSDSLEKPEANSGFSFIGGIPCSIQKNISRVWKRRFRIPIVGVGLRRLDQAQITRK